jgi:hypothetical protein
MRIVGRSVSLAAIIASVSFAVASAATPKVGATYVGFSASHKPLRITVSHDASKGKLTYCGYTVRIHIVRDHFGVHKTIAGGQVSVFRIHGSWKTKQLVSGKIDLNFGCDGRPGSWSATLK